MSQDRMQSPPSVPSIQFDVAEALRRARLADTTVSRPARRTLAEMAPGFERQPVLTLFRPQFSNDERCIFCEKWLCPGNCGGFAPAPAAAAGVAKVAA
ncbi:hypothetical protein [Streptomyces roseoviridis]|uniref:4Fe-4S ferredoxin-type domain-containing protein n=1 Tax=Streptomyces roseoviridis TaxID=67361 RepID=A0ABV5QYT3_9ACTN